VARSCLIGRFDGVVLAVAIHGVDLNVSFDDSRSIEYKFSLFFCYPITVLISGTFPRISDVRSRNLIANSSASS
jgi:hypothetical protein